MDDAMHARCRENSGFSCCRREKFLFCERMRASALTGVAPEPPGDSGRIVWGVFHFASEGVFRFDSGCMRAHPWVYPPSLRLTGESVGG